MFMSSDFIFFFNIYNNLRFLIFLKYLFIGKVNSESDSNINSIEKTDQMKNILCKYNRF